jgi:two-component system response regulator FimZ (fimbrial Z protein)
MKNTLESGTGADIALVGPDCYARQGIASLMLRVGISVQIRASTCECHLFDSTLEKIPVDVIFISGPEKGSRGHDCLNMIRNIRTAYPQATICMYSSKANSLLSVQGNVDAYISLKEPLYRWQTALLKLVDKRYRNKMKSGVLSLTSTEWKVLKELKKGLDLRHIAEVEKLSYRRVSAIKASAIKKLGLRNKTDLLVFLTH